MRLRHCCRRWQNRLRRTRMVQRRRDDMFACDPTITATGWTVPGAERAEFQNARLVSIRTASTSCHGGTCRISISRPGDAVLPILRTLVAGRLAYFPVLDEDIEIARTTNFRRRSKYFRIKTLNSCCLLHSSALRTLLLAHAAKGARNFDAEIGRASRGAIRHIGNRLKVSRELVVAPSLTKILHDVRENRLLKV